MRLCWSHISHCWKSCVAAHIIFPLIARQLETDFSFHLLRFESNVAKIPSHYLDKRMCYITVATACEKYMFNVTFKVICALPTSVKCNISIVYVVGISITSQCFPYNIMLF